MANNLPDYLKAPGMAMQRKAYFMGQSEDMADSIKSKFSSPVAPGTNILSVLGSDVSSFFSGSKNSNNTGGSSIGTSSVLYGTWADRQSPQQVLWESRISTREPEALDAVMKMFGASGPILKNLHNMESTLKAAQGLLNQGEYIPPRNSQISRDVYQGIKHKYTNLFVATATGINENTVIFGQGGGAKSGFNPKAGGLKTGGPMGTGMTGGLGALGSGLSSLTGGLGSGLNSLTGGLGAVTGGIGQGLGAVTGGIGQGLGAATNMLATPAARFVDAFQPISSFIGTTLGTMPGMVPNHLLHGIDTGVGSLLNRISPRLKQEMHALQSALHLDKLSHLPSQIAGSVRHVMSAVNKLLAAPAHIMYDLFKGAIGAVQKMAAMVNGVFKTLQNLAQKAVGMVAGALGGIVQGLVGNIMGALGPLAGKLQSIMGGFSGMSLLNNFSNGLLGKLGSLPGGIGANMLGKINLKNPLDASKIFNNPKLGMLRGFQLNNPLDAKNKLIPPSISKNMGSVMGKVSSFGMVGNMGLGLTKSLDSVKSGVLASVLGNFSSQASILNHIFTGQEATPHNFSVGNSLTRGYDGVKYATDVSRNVIQQYPPDFILPHKS
jgi:hypothetical protein